MTKTNTHECEPSSWLDAVRPTSLLLMKIFGSKRLDLVLEVHCSVLHKSSTIVIHRRSNEPIYDQVLHSLPTCSLCTNSSSSQYWSRPHHMVWSRCVLELSVVMLCPQLWDDRQVWCLLELITSAGNKDLL